MDRLFRLLLLLGFSFLFVFVFLFPFPFSLFPLLFALFASSRVNWSQLGQLTGFERRNFQPNGGGEIHTTREEATSVGIGGRMVQRDQSMS